MVLAQRGFEVIGAVGSATEALAQIAEHRPDVVLMDLSLPGMSGIEATRRLTAAEPPVPVVALTVVASGPQVIEAFQAGAWGYLLKDASIDQIVDAIRAAVRKESVLSPRVAARVVAWLREPQGDRTRHRCAAVQRPPARDPRAGGEGRVQSADRQHAVPQRAHREDARVQHPAQARGGQSHPSRGASRPRPNRVDLDRDGSGRGGGYR